MSSEENIKSGVNKIGLLVGILIKLLIPLGILIIALMIAKYFMETSQEAQMQEVSQQSKLVEVTAVERTNVQAIIYAMGTVIPAREVALMPQVSGQVISLSPEIIAGSLVRAGTNLLKIDSRDYEFFIQQSSHAVAQAQLDLKLEQGNQVVAKAEYKMLEELVSQEDCELVLRELHLKQAEAALKASEAELAQARLNLERCQITAPFNGVVREKYIDLGASVSPSTQLLRLIGTDEYWIEIAVRTDELELIHIPDSNNNDDGSMVRIFNKSQWDSNTSRQGSIIRLLPTLETNGRMARLLVSVQDPLSLNADDMPLLLIGSYVHAEIAGKIIYSVFPLKREYLRNGDTVWIMNQDNCLEIRPVQIAYRDKSFIYIREGLEATDRIIITNIETPIENMPVSLSLHLMENTTNQNHLKENQ